jgi:hypothetical protein
MKCAYDEYHICVLITLNKMCSGMLNAILGLGNGIITSEFYLIIISSVFNIISLAGQSVTLPLFVNSFDDGDHHANPYFVLLFSSIAFMMFFFTLATYQHFKYGKPLKASITMQAQFLKIGALNALNGILVVYASPPSRTPVDLQSILVQSILPYTFISSYFIKGEVPQKFQSIGASTVAFGIAISLIPVFMSLANIGDFSFKNLIWCAVFLAGNLPAALCNVYQDSTLKTYDGEIEIIQLLAWSSLYQLIVMVCAYWTGFVPGFGFSSSPSEFTSEMKYSIGCYFGECSGTWFIGLVFTIFYIITYITTGVLVKYRTANYTTLLNSISVSVAITFWILFPKLNDRTIGPIEITCDYVSAALVCFGIWIYTRQQDIKNGYTAINDVDL